MSQIGSHYPYGASPLRPQWHDRWARGLAVLVSSCAVSSLFMHLPVWPIDRLALTILLPALLGTTLGFAPDPPALVSRLAKRLTVVGCAVGSFAGPWLAPMILGVPVLLALSVVIGSLWEDRR